MVKIKFKRETAPYLISIAVIVLDIGIIFMTSLAAIDFDLSKLSTSKFWASYITTLALTLIAYFATIGSGKKKATDKEEYSNILQALDDKREIVSNNFLDDKRDAFIDAKNRVEKLKAFIILIDKKLAKVKKDEKREQYKKAKNAGIAALKLAVLEIDCKATITDDEREQCESLISAIDFNIDSIKVPYRKIDKRVLSTGLMYHVSKKIGHYDESTIIARDSFSKVLFSLVLTALFTAIIPSEKTYTLNVIFQVVWRVLMVVLNAYMGLTEGYKLINDYKTAAIKEQIEVYNLFLNYCLDFGILKKKTPAAMTIE